MFKLSHLPNRMGEITIVVKSDPEIVFETRYGVFNTHDGFGYVNYDTGCVYLNLLEAVKTRTLVKAYYKRLESNE